MMPSLRQTSIIALVLLSSLPVLFAAIGDSIPLGLCNEVAREDTITYQKYIKKKYHAVPNYPNAIGPAWKLRDVPNLIDMTLTINTDSTFSIDPKYYFHMDTSDPGDNYLYQFIIKMSVPGKVTRIISPTNFMTCFIHMQDPKDTPKWEYYLDLYSYTERK